MPLFSIIIPVYNAYKWLRACLESIHSQSFSDWEAILIDDGSVDGSDKICDEYAQADRHFRTVHQRNSGVSVARNVGMQEAMGNYILFVDADDMLLPDALAVLAEVVARNPECDLVQFGYQEEQRLYCAKNAFFGTADAFFAQNILPPRTVWGALFKRTLAMQVSFPTGLPVAEDTEYSVRCHFLAKRIGVIPQVLYSYRKDLSSVMRSRISPEKVRSILTVIGHLEKGLKPRSNSEKIAKQRIIERLRISFYQMLYRTYGERRELLAEYRGLNLPSAKYIRALRVADAFPWLYFFIIKHIRHVPQ